MSASSFKSYLYGVWYAFISGAWAVISVLGISAAIIGGVFYLAAQVVAIDVESLSAPGWTLALYALQYGIGLAVLLIVPVLIQKKRRQQLKELFGLTRGIVTNDVAKAFLAFLPYFAVSLALQSIVATFITGFDVDQTQDIGFSDLSGTGQLVLAFLALVVLAPLAEELVFRGFVFGNARTKLDFWPAAIITSLFFGFVHGQWNVGLDTFVLSLALCYLREKTGAIWASVLLHAIKNGLAYTLLFIVPVG